MESVRILNPSKIFKVGFALSILLFPEASSIFSCSTSMGWGLWFIFSSPDQSYYRTQIDQKHIKRLLCVLGLENERWLSFLLVLSVTGTPKLRVVGQIVGCMRINLLIKFLSNPLNKFISEMFYFAPTKALVQSCNFLLWQIFKVFQISIVV